MNKILRSTSIKCIALLLGYIAAVSVVRGFSVGYDFFMHVYFRDWLKMDPAVSLLLFIVCTALFLVSVWRTENSTTYSIENDKSPHPWRTFDGALLIMLIYGFVLLCMRFTQRDLRLYGTSFSSWQLLLFPAAAYIAVMLLLAEWTARIRDGRWAQTLYWLRFFRAYPLWRPMGCLMALSIAVNVSAIFILCPVRAATAAYLNVPLLLFLLGALCTLTYFCIFILSLSSEYEKANEEKIRGERFKSELITNVSHDIRTPLTSIINYVDLLKALPVENETFVEYMDILDKKTARLKTLIDDLMEASKAGTGNITVDLREIDLAEIMGQIAGEFDERFIEGDLTLVCRLPDEPVPVVADSRHLWRILENLFGNAAKYALPGTRVFAEMDVRAGETAILLKNTSRSPIDLSGDALAEQFIRGDRARQTEGNGLGLYIAKSLTEHMGGRFAIRVSGDLFEVEIVLPS